MRANGGNRQTSIQKQTAERYYHYHGCVKQFDGTSQTKIDSMHTGTDY